MHVVIFEGSRWGTFAPLSLSRPVFMLVTGMSTLLDKHVRHLRPTRLTLWVRPAFADYCRARVAPTLPCPTQVNAPLDGEPALLISARAVHLSKFEYPPHDAVVMDEGGKHVQAAMVRDPGLGPADIFGRTDRWLRVHDLPHMMPQSRVVEALWDLIHWNEESLIEDVTTCCSGIPKDKPAGPYHMVHDEDVWLRGPGAVNLEPGVVLDASRGPVVIDAGATIGANSVLKGPCYVGPHAVLRPLTVVRAGTSIGPFCNVGGEVSNSIILDNSNKAHDGYLGDSYVGKWVNLGAGTCTSNLKNTYGEISMQMGDGSPDVPTGRVKLGALIGDHSKTAVLTRLSTGTYVGFYAMLAGPGPVPRFVPSYTFWTERGPEPYRLDKAIEVTRRVYGRRDRPFTDEDEHVMRYVAETAPASERRTGPNG